MVTHRSLAHPATRRTGPLLVAGGLLLMRAGLWVLGAGHAPRTARQSETAWGEGLVAWQEP